MVSVNLDIKLVLTLSGIRTIAHLYNRTMHIKVGDSYIETGVHEGRVKGVDLIFIHRGDIFPVAYPSGNAWQTTRMLSFIAKASLEVLCQKELIPSMIITNDWFAGLVAPYARTGHFGRPSPFANTKFLHLVHNLDENYEGRQYPAPHDGNLYALHHLPVDLLVDPYWERIVINPSRAALLASDTWATVSNSYKKVTFDCMVYSFLVVDNHILFLFSNPHRTY